MMYGRSAPGYAATLSRACMQRRRIHTSGVFRTAFKTAHCRVNNATAQETFLQAMHPEVDVFYRPAPQLDGFAQVRDLSKLGVLQRHPQTGLVLPVVLDGRRRGHSFGKPT